MNELSDILNTATASVDQNYFLLPRYEGSDVLRERHYCYELYHQMRCSWPKQQPFILSGEIDKNSHYYIRDLIDSYPIPDFLIHIPGTMDNYAIIEVKTTNLPSEGIKKDLETLSIFVERAKYQRAIFLIFGHSFSKNKLERIKNAYTNLSANGVNVQPIEIWLHDTCGQSAKHLITLENK
ncbi:hypothetical protein U8433_001033 [Salmonella enterica]|uniref:Methionyl-tRNA formyltransferase-like protein n=1 Tax=Salmonella diarizonae TaxID=59204 RepID=A0A635J3S5_SALDZ|nr:methionyl-tRNA formyltransferase-like protein [Salmonella enterica subsp. diarizonae]EEN5928813.1 methionyl-tRNA formyltransferase-like protein [Salmonella enterica]HCM1910647.1 hypothetical protein [Salmonella enterica subsp. diarizonae serovar 53:k:e,n,x,z15]EDV3803315.1 methionyl-tRNA formyltransferase-like protein [Salmonella enterica subsp. diarizonae]EFT3018369.1 methionyl-tRNA formyltransferase-like protein [Salmonella enterica]